MDILNWIRVIAVAASVGAVAMMTLAQDLDKADVDFMKQAAHNGQAEVESSRLALSKSSNRQVKSFAQRMVTDHTQAGESLKTLARSKHLELPSEPSMTQKAQLKLLGGMSGDSFDKRYADHVGVDDHEKTVALFRKTASEAHDPDVKAFAASTLPKLEEHLSMAKDLKAAVHSAR